MSSYRVNLDIELTLYKMYKSIEKREISMSVAKTFKTFFRLMMIYFINKPSIWSFPSLIVILLQLVNLVDIGFFYNLWDTLFTFCYKICGLYCPLVIHESLSIPKYLSNIWNVILFSFLTLYTAITFSNWEEKNHFFS